MMVLTAEGCSWAEQSLACVVCVYTHTHIHMCVGGHRHTQREASLSLLSEEKEAIVNFMRGYCFYSSCTWLSELTQL